MRKDRHVANLLKFFLGYLGPCNFWGFFHNYSFYIDTPHRSPCSSTFSHPIWILEIPQETHQIMYGFGCFFSIPQIYGFAGWEFPFMMFFFPNYYIFPCIFPPKPHTTIINQPPTTPHHPYHHHSTLHADRAEQLGRTLRFVEISVAGRHGQRVRGMAGNQKFPRETNIAMENPHLFW